MLKVYSFFPAANSARRFTWWLLLSIETYSAATCRKEVTASKELATTWSHSPDTSKYD
jgi:hypothetical protein